MLRFLIGKAGAGKTAALMEEIRQRVADERPGAILLVPEQYSHEAERELCRVCGDSLSLYGEVFSFTGLARRVLQHHPAAGHRPLDGDPRKRDRDDRFQSDNKIQGSFHAGRIRRRPLDVYHAGRLSAVKTGWIGLADPAAGQSRRGALRAVPVYPVRFGGGRLMGALPESFPDGPPLPDWNSDL